MHGMKVGEEIAKRGCTYKTLTTFSASWLCDLSKYLHAHTIIVYIIFVRI